ncbi:ABC transporter ATP-binding protein [Vagococcus humatus]|uniref:ABC transporter ATP-binding protein n=1 Tax=Vagococcus humatus TaxID=1889241 RepID=A0A429Z8L7_9ENTE|nr:ABC transporter ATP-binding protein [Vagococcus humatus]RST90028.1 ABC transporter ATP-binding protein [Vagococcus humatus]
MNPLIISHLDKSFKKKQVLKDISFVLEGPHIYGLLGRNGSGKSTLFNLINNRLTPDRGQVLLDGKPVLEDDDGLEQLFLANHTTLMRKDEKGKVKKYIRLANQFYPDFDQELCEHLIRVFDLNVNTRIDKLSTGYQTIFNIILALCVPASFIFLDEPTLGLDANHREIFYKELLTTFAKRPRTFIISTHLIDELAQIMDQVILLDQGQIKLADSVENLLAHSYALTGNQEDIEAFMSNYHVIGSERIGNQFTVYIYDTKELTDLPDTIQKSPIDLQRVFIELTTTRGGLDYHEA